MVRYGISLHYGTCYVLHVLYPAGVGDTLLYVSSSVRSLAIELIGFTPVEDIIHCCTRINQSTRLYCYKIFISVQVQASEHQFELSCRNPLDTKNVLKFCTVSVFCCVFSSHSFWTSSSLDVPAGVTQEDGHTGFLSHLPSAVHAFILLTRRIQPFLSIVDREVEFCVLTIQSFSTSWAFFFFFFFF